MADDRAAKSMRFAAGEAGEVSALLLRPPATKAMLVLAHGAGAGMRHSFMEAIAAQLAREGVATFRYQFPYTERGRRRPDTKPVLLETVRRAVTTATAAAPGLPLLAGGKSMGGRMTSLAAATTRLARVRGLVFLGFPLHGAGQPPGIERAAHLAEVALPMLFCQGTRDELADIELMRGVCERLGSRATLHVVDGADHSFHVLKRSGRTDGEVLAEMGAAVSAWAARLAGDA